MLRSAPFETPPAAAPQDKRARLEARHGLAAADLLCVEAEVTGALGTITMGGAWY